MGGARRLRMPPRIKYLEAAGAIGDGRVLVSSRDGVLEARVVGSDGSRRYRVVVLREAPGRYRVYSDDNGTRLRGYVGYPVIAVLMLAGELPRDPRVEEALRGVPWRRLNEELKRYSLVMERVLGLAEERGLPRARAESLIERASRALRRLTLVYDPGLAGEGPEDAVEG